MVRFVWLSVLMNLASFQIVEAKSDFLINENHNPKPIPMRIVSLAPNITQMMYALGAEDRLVGVTRFCEGPLGALIVGGLNDPQYEIILNLEPDLVCLSGLSSEGVEARLRDLGLNTLRIAHEGLAGVLQDIETLGRALGLDEAAQGLTQQMRSAQKSIEAHAALYPKKRVLFLLGEANMYSAGPGSFIHEMIVSAGGENIAGGLATLWPRLSREFIIDKDPEVICIACEHEVNVAHYQQDSFWRQLPAVRAGKVYGINPSLINIPGPSLIEGLEAIAGCLEL